MILSLRTADHVVVTTIKLAAIAASLLVLGATFATFYEVVARYVFGSPTTWSMDSSIYMLMWAVFLGAAYTMHTHGHVCVDLLVAKLPCGARLALKATVLLGVGAFSGLLAWRGGVACVEAYRFGEVTLSYLRTPMYVPMSAIPVGCGLLSVEVARELVQLFRRGAEEDE